MVKVWRNAQGQLTLIVLERELPEPRFVMREPYVESGLSDFIRLRRTFKLNSTGHDERVVFRKLGG